MKLAVRGPQILANYLLDQIIYRDKNIIAINKPAFLPIHGPCRNEPISLKKFHGPTLAGLLSHFKFGNHHAPFIVHRLDKNTTGVLLLARRDSIARKLSALFSTHGAVIKQYFAIVEAPSSWNEEMVSQTYKLISTPIEVACFDTNDVAIQKPCLTEYKIVALKSCSFGKIALLDLRPTTGRTHQLRIHCSQELHAPILGDQLYGGNLAPCKSFTDPSRFLLQKTEQNISASKTNPFVNGGNLFLHCRSITIPPMLQGGSELLVEAPFPDHFLRLFPKLC